MTRADTLAALVDASGGPFAHSLAPSAVTAASYGASMSVAPQHWQLLSPTGDDAHAASLRARGMLPNGDGVPGGLVMASRGVSGHGGLGLYEASLREAPAPVSIVLADVPVEATDVHVTDFFSKFGQIRRLEFVAVPTGARSGPCVLTFSDAAGAARAAAAVRAGAAVAGRRVTLAAGHYAAHGSASA
jgi:hypothetical protein